MKGMPIAMILNINRSRAYARNVFPSFSSITFLTSSPCIALFSALPIVVLTSLKIARPSIPNLLTIERNERI